GGGATFIAQMGTKGAEQLLDPVIGVGRLDGAEPEIESRGQLSQSSIAVERAGGFVQLPGAADQTRNTIAGLQLNAGKHCGNCAWEAMDRQGAGPCPRRSFRFRS